MKARLDKLLMERQLCRSRSRAQQRTLDGEVRVNGQIIRRPGTLVDAMADISFVGEDIPYVSRGGVKLAAALDHWKIDLAGRVCLDIGASTGGFTDCMLQRGAGRVVCVDVGKGQLAPQLRADPRTCPMEQTHARDLHPAMLPADISLITVDVSFIAASLVLPNVIASAFSTPLAAGRPGRCVVVLVKPQFEAGREHVGKGGIVRSATAQTAAVERVRQVLLDCGASRTDVIDSPVFGGDGNREFLLYAEFPFSPGYNATRKEQAVPFTKAARTGKL
jgi:23S rRNA (cytidine1920-2'-O)/16S rRNA (cytidine1409-2'-O)-methyltransferase